MGELIRTWMIIVFSIIVTFIQLFVTLKYFPQLEYPVLIFTGVPICFISILLLLISTRLAIEQKADIRTSIILFIIPLFIAIVEGAASLNLLVMGVIPFIALIDLIKMIKFGEFILLLYIILFFLIQIVIGSLLFFVTIKNIEKPKKAFMIAIVILALMVAANFVFVRTGFGEEKLAILQQKITELGYQESNIDFERVVQQDLNEALRKDDINSCVIGECQVAFAIAKNNVQYCFDMSHIGFIPDCVSKFGYNMDPSICGTLPKTESSKKNCIEGFKYYADIEYFT